MTDHPQLPRYRPVDLTSRRECRFPGCRRKSARGHAFCPQHGVSEEAVAYYRELQQASAYFDLALQSLDPDKADRAEAYHRFRRRAQRGDFSQLFDKPTRALLEQAAALPDHSLEVGALRFALARAVSEETDPARLGLTVARLAHAIARLAADHPTTESDRRTTAALRLLDDALPKPADPDQVVPLPEGSAAPLRPPLSAGRGVGGAGDSTIEDHHTTHLPVPPGTGRGTRREDGSDTDAGGHVNPPASAP